MLPGSIMRDAEAFYQQHHRPVYAFLLRLTGSPETADDLLQETFYRAFKGAASYRGESPVGWLCTIARRAFADQVQRWERERGRQGAVAWEQIPDPAPGPEAAVLSGERQARIAGILQTMPEPQRMALLLRDFDGLAYETIAEILGLSLANVKVTIHRARARFRAEYLASKE